MPPQPSKRKAYDYAERIRARLPRRLQELREAVGLSKYALAQRVGISREMVSRVEGQRSIPTFDLALRR